VLSEEIEALQKAKKEALTLAENLEGAQVRQAEKHIKFQGEHDNLKSRLQYLQVWVLLWMWVGVLGMGVFERVWLYVHVSGCGCVGMGGCGCGYVKKFDALVGRAVFATPAAVTFIGLHIFDVQWVID